jgi:predicted flap endonuclease-1-like 5' DNA nuclease
MKKEYLAKKGKYKVTFALPKQALEGHKDVVLLGDFNDWDRSGIPMVSENGHYKADLELTAGRYEFRYLIDNEKWENDWQADGYVSSPFTGIENSVIVLDKKEEKATTEPAPKKVTQAAAPKPVIKKATKKVVATTAVPNKKGRKKKEISQHDLTIIEGIGPKISKVLKEAGIDTFKKLAAKKPKQISKILTDVNPRYRIYTPDTWPDQAKLAAAEKWTELETLKKELNGGRVKK